MQDEIYRQLQMDEDMRLGLIIIGGLCWIALLLIVVFIVWVIL